VSIALAYGDASADAGRRDHTWYMLMKVSGFSASNASQS
jgi:hypothetical protein